MNIINEKGKDSIINITFNQDNSCFAISTEKGFKIYNSYPFEGPYERIMDGGLGVVEMLYKSNYLALIGGGKSPKFNNNKVVIWDEYSKRIIGELKFIIPVINIKLKKDLLFVICQSRIYLFDLNTYDIIDTIETNDNIKGLIAINNAPNNTVLAYPTEKSLNWVAIKKIKSKKDLIFEAQDDKISQMSINYDGTLLATSNTKGTIVKIHSCVDGQLLKIFKRGHNKVENIFICFEKENKFMAIGSSKGTIHIFSLKSIIKKLKDKEEKDKEEKDKEEKDKEEKDKEEKDKEEKNKDKNEIKIIVHNEIINEDKKENKIENDIKNEIGNEFEIINKNKIIDINEDLVTDNKKEDLSNKNENQKELKKETEDYKNNIINENNKKEEFPDNSKNLFGSEISFAKIKLKPQKNVCAFIKSNLLIVITFDNKYYQAEIDLKKGGICKILEEKTI